MHEGLAGEAVRHFDGIACGVDIRQIRAKVVIHTDAPAVLDGAALEESQVGLHAGGNDEDIGFQDFPGGEPDGFRPAIAPKCIRLRIQADIHATPQHLVEGDRGGVLIEHLDLHYADAQLAQQQGDLHADETRADDDGCPCLSMPNPGDDCFGGAQGLEVVYAGQVGAGDRCVQAAADGDDEAVVTEGVAILELEAARLRIDANHLCGLPVLHAGLLPPVCGPPQMGVRAVDEVIRHRRGRIGQARLGAEHEDLAAAVELAGEAQFLERETPELPLIGILPSEPTVQEADRLGVPVDDYVPALREAAWGIVEKIGEGRG